MIAYEHLMDSPSALMKVTGMRRYDFECWLAQAAQRLDDAEAQCPVCNPRRHTPGGDSPRLRADDQIVMALMWLRLYPTQDVLGYCFEIPQLTVGHYLSHALPLLEQIGIDHLKWPDSGRRRRSNLTELFSDVPELVLVIQRSRQAQPSYGHGGECRPTARTQTETSSVANLSADESGHTGPITAAKETDAWRAYRQKWAAWATALTGGPDQEMSSL